MHGGKPGSYSRKYHHVFRWLEVRLPVQKEVYIVEGNDENTLETGQRKMGRAIRFARGY